MVMICTNNLYVLLPLILQQISNITISMMISYNVSKLKSKIIKKTKYFYLTEWVYYYTLIYAVILGTIII